MVPMERANKILGRALRRLHQPEAAIVWLAGTWPHVVGTALAAHTRPVRCQNGCLEISADSKSWEVQLLTIEREFRAAVNCAWGGDLVREIKFVRARRQSPIAHEHDNQHTPFIRRAKS
jgi:predicted nucleic acid-binding Zn ribbon protein